MSSTAKTALMLTAAALVGWACTSDPSAPETSQDGARTTEGRTLVEGDSAVVGLGHTVVFDDFGIAVTYRALEQDSRCPVGLTCVWAGDAAVRISVAQRDRRREAVLHTALEPGTLRLDGALIELLDVLPPPVHGESHEPSETRIVVRVAALSQGR